MEITEFIDHLSRCRVYQMPEEEILPMLQELETASRVIAAMSAELAAEAETRSLHLRHGCKTLAVLLRDTLVLSPAESRRRARLVHDLPGLPETRKVFRAGAIQPEHVVVISDVVRKLPVESREEVEASLAGHARALNPQELEKAGKHLRALVDPDGTYREEQEGIARRSLKFYRDSHGWLGIRGTLDPEAGEALQAAMHALAKPRPVDGVKDPRTPEQRYADALTELVRVAMASETLPGSGGERPQVVITVPFQALRDGVSAGWASWGGPLTAQLIRTLACDAKIIPVVLNGKSVPLDVGREQRTAPKGLRRALAVRDQGCAFPGCDRPPVWTEAHHVVHWSNGGPTSLDNMVLLCSHHHHLLHQGDWEIRFDNGLPVFLPPPWIDTDRTPRHNIRLAA